MMTPESNTGPVVLLSVVACPATQGTTPFTGRSMAVSGSRHDRPRRPPISVLPRNDGSLEKKMSTASRLSVENGGMGRFGLATALLVLLSVRSVFASAPNASPRPAILLARSAKIIALSRQNWAALYDIRAGEKTCEFREKHRIEAMSVTADEQLLAIGCRDGAVSVWDVADHGRIWRATCRGHVNDVSFSGDGRLLSYLQ